MSSSKAMHPELREERQRISTFRKWPKQLPQEPFNMVKAGFYYTGYGDCVVCYFCGGGMKDWEPKDDPWEEHATNYPECPLVQQYLKRRENEKKAKLNQQSIKPGHCFNCKNEKPSVCFLPCEHIIACRDCSESLNECPMCFDAIVQKINVYY